MKILIAEDDYVSQRLMQKILQTLGPCDLAVNGIEAVEAFHKGLKVSNPYELVFLDIRMPEMDGKEVLLKIREIEAQYAIEGLDRVKVIMITALDDHQTILQAFRDQCEAYFVKPIEKRRLLEKLVELKLIEPDSISMPEPPGKSRFMLN